MDFKFTTIEECEEKIKQMKDLTLQLEEISYIQFPIPDNKKEQFHHYYANLIINDICDLKANINGLEKELKRYKKVMENKKE